METSKQKAIREAWGVHYSHDIDENGFRTYSEFDAHQLNQWVGDYWKNGFNEISKKYWVRPKSLQGIETNNGWIKIESEADLPKEDCDCHIIYKDGSMSIDKFYINYKNFNTNHHFHITHYQPISKPLKPIY